MSSFGTRLTRAGKLTRLGIYVIPLCVAMVSLFSPVMAECFGSPGHEGFGLQSFEASVVNRDGSPDVQAGSHPYEFTMGFAMNEPEFEAKSGKFLSVGGGVKDVELELPPGFVGNPNAIPKCSYAEFLALKCPNDTAMGEATSGIVTTNGFVSRRTGTLVNQVEYFTNPVYNVEPPGVGVAAEFGFVAGRASPVLVDASVRTGRDYGITAGAQNITEAIVPASVEVTIWGVPAEASHDSLRGECLGTGLSDRSEAENQGIPHNEEESLGVCPADIPVEPFLTNPPSCGEAREMKLSVDSWNDPGNFATGENVFLRSVLMPEIEGCEKLDFSPTLTVAPDGSAGSTPTGLNVGVHVPQEATSNPVGLGEADIKTTTVALPVGTAVNPAAADGLESCTGNPADPPGTPGNEIGFEGRKEVDPVGEHGVLVPAFSSSLPEHLEPGVNFCPDASKIANVRIKTPLLEGEVTGSVYLASPQNFSVSSGAPEENPSRSLIAMYLVAAEQKTGVLVKLPGEVSLCKSVGEELPAREGATKLICEAAGQIVTTFEHTPELPYSEASFEFYGTDRAPLATPALCKGRLGEPEGYEADTSLVPWSGEQPVMPGAQFSILSGPNSSGCPNGEPFSPSLSQLPFAPSLVSGTPNVNAGSFSALTTTLTREDGQQNIQSVQLKYPAGLSGILTGVPLCPEPQADAGTCSSASEIGETIVSVGLGDDPFTVTGGKAYITGPYNGTGSCTVGEPGCAPFGLSIVNPAKAGPFVLQEGAPVVVRAKIEINPTTAALTVTTNSSSQPYHIPTMIEGIPLQIKHVNVNISRPGFTFNPTNCDPAEITGTIASAEGASSPVKIPFQVANCAALKFAPEIQFSTSGKTSKANGADLITKVSYPYGPQGTYANVGYVKVELPKELPSRLTTLQKACTSVQFEANPAGCPPASDIGHAVVHTPLLPVPLEGPAIFVSHGGEAFPSLTMVLQGYGVKIDLVGTTFISKAGITSTTFKTVPDQPFSTFELVLPQGPFSALAANGNLCTQKLEMPTEFVGQNGTPVRQTSTVSVTGCKPAIYVTKHSVKGKTATITVSVPAAGKLLATAKGLSKASKTASGRETVSLVLNQKKGGKLKTNIKLTFTPSKGAKQTKTVTVRFKK